MDSKKRTRDECEACDAAPKETLFASVFRAVDFGSSGALQLQFVPHDERRIRVKALLPLFALPDLEDGGPDAFGATRLSSREFAYAKRALVERFALVLRHCEHFVMRASRVSFEPADLSLVPPSTFAAVACSVAFHRIGEGAAEAEGTAPMSPDLPFVRLLSDEEEEVIVNLP